MSTSFTFKEITEVNKDTYRIVLGDIPRAIAPSLGNALRRLIKQCTPGFAIVEVAFEGTLHQYQRVNHVAEDVLAVLQNLKNTKLTIEGNYQTGERELFKYQFQGPRMVKAEDLNTGLLTVTNPQKHLFEILSAVEINLQIHVEYSTGFHVYDRDKHSGFLPLMAVFNPIKGVFCKDNLDTHPDLSNLEILLETYGTVDPRQVIKNALHQYYRCLQVLKHPVELEAKKIEVTNNKLLEQGIDTLALSARAYNCLAPLGITTIGELISYSYAELLILPNMGNKSLDKMVSQLQMHDLQLRDTNQER
jgi:DNA-directed RNA polymerase alpha subunit